MAHFGSTPSSPRHFINLACLELEALERFGSYPRLHYETQAFTNKEEFEYAGRIARVLRERGIGPGDRVMAVLPNTPDLTACFQAAWIIGAVIVPVTPMWSSAELAYAISNSEAAAIVCCAPLASLVYEAASQAGSRCRLLSFGPTKFPQLENIAGEIVDSPCIDSPINRCDTDTALILYTSGTTAKPKGVVVTHGNVLAAINSVMRVNPELSRGAMLHVLPLTHIFGMLMLQLSNRWGLQSVLIRQFDPVAVYNAIQRHRAAYVLAVPTMLLYLLHHPERAKFDLSSLRRVISGGAGLPDQLRQAFQQAFRCRIEQGYGMSETGFAACYAEDEAYRPGSVGRPCPGFELRVVNQVDDEVPRRSVGEICMRSPSITPGYWNDADATRSAFRNDWFHTGDVGFVDEQGYLYITDRKKDLIIKGGENISPREIEEVLLGITAIAEVAVVGIPDPTFGEDICAFVQLRAGASICEDEIRQQLAQRLSRFKMPARIVFQAAIPKNHTGKIDKRKIREQFALSAAA